MNRNQIISDALKIDGLICEEELNFLFDYIIQKIRFGMKILEIGTFKGRTSYMLARMLEGIGSITTIDCFGRGDFRPEYTGYTKEECLKNLEDLKNLEIVDGVSVSEDVLSKLEDRYDVIILDGDHTLDYLRKEIPIFSQKTDHLIGHDYNLPDVFSAVNEFCTNSGFRIIDHSVVNKFFEIVK